MSQNQFDLKGHLQHLLTLADFPRKTLTALLDRAEQFRVNPGDLSIHYDLLAGKTIVNLFFEPSTRTRTSFELAARRLGAQVITLDMAFSSTAKGESLLDTLYTLEAMNADLFVVRHQEPGTLEILAQHALPHVHIINAGESSVSHPTQGLLDVLTIRQHKKNFKKLSVAIVGDIRHSRVARSVVHALSVLGSQDIRFAGPAELLPDDLAGEKYTNLDKALEGVDVVISLRIQKERMQAGLIPDERDYARRYGLDNTRLRLAKPDVLVMHPGPMNRDVEITSEVADGPRSVIREQVANGVAVRMAVMATLMGK
ncbi:MAG TPA: aspartate carbamoyltransferase catalytic subunit [Gammaproteobacteria bacterium]|nr:aspartate carbamoyltransferase catalytic subunit [Gammaproteobacteria bacterium]